MNNNNNGYYYCKSILQNSINIILNFVILYRFISTTPFGHIYMSWKKRKEKNKNVVRLKKMFNK